MVDIAIGVVVFIERHVGQRQGMIQAVVLRLHGHGAAQKLDGFAHLLIESVQPRQVQQDIHRLLTDAGVPVGFHFGDGFVHAAQQFINLGDHEAQSLVFLIGECETELVNRFQIYGLLIKNGSDLGMDIGFVRFEGRHFRHFDIIGQPGGRDDIDAL